VVGLAVDVSDREQALAQAHRSQAELEEFFGERAGGAFVGRRWTARSSVPTGPKLDLLGYQPDEIPGPEHRAVLRQSGGRG